MDPDRRLGAAARACTRSVDRRTVGADVVVKAQVSAAACSQVFGAGVLACGSMRIRASILTTARAAGVLIAITAGVACSHPSGKLMVDSPKMLPYQAPDIDEITGIDPDEAEEDAAAATAQNPQQAPTK